ncbi:RHS repeat-associated core domain-containing protein [Rhodoferax mekongensis]|uniref:RHS repeat-associated core domain-containing protein n=2 Tax=Rhodoferax mekongensis TaxID=3068341 RepID=UPI0028BED0DF|nr:RHS repeat-associated core domain-containing protein [Rhodoferax sp. TBRC 17199]MDT7517135.1 RHS repeat-associated core domain-containing protein [Rhodoferax sp. TBRC 17199]
MNQSTFMNNRKLRVVLAALIFTTGAVKSQTQSQTTVFTKNAQGQMASVTDAMGNKVDYQYDALGNLVRTNAAGSVTSLQYDVRGNKIAMQDPAMGSWTYGYNAFGELVTQRDSLNQTTAMAYDVLGRMTKRTEPDLVSDWSYDQKFDGTGCGKGVGKLCEAKTDNNYKRTHTYDSMGRLGSTATVLDSVASPATVSESFDVNTGRVATKTWPTGYQVSYSYTPLGYLSSVSGGGTTSFPQSTSYQILGMTPHGQVTKYRTGNQVTVINTYDPLVERLVGQTGTTDGQTAGNVINQAYRFNALGNLLARLDNTPGVGTQESFSYDSLNRLTTATILGGAVSPPTSTEVMYDTRGNITYKSDVGRYWYDAARPNRMTNVTLETAPGATVPLSGTRALSYAFDDGVVNAQSVNGTTVGNGNLTYTVSRDTVNNIHTVRFESYTSFNMPAQIVYGNYVTNTSSTSDRTLSFLYGPEHQRIKQNVALSGNGTSAYFSGNTWYLNGEDSLGLTYEKEVRSNGTTEHKHYLTAQGTTFALFTSRTGTLNGLPATTTSYFHKDQMGSVAAITDATGAVTERLAYDPWGKRRFINTTPGLTDRLDAIVGVKTDRGYTEHEHLDEVGVIHMNGRIYDPLMGRFMSADPIIQSPDDLRSFNRYSYVWNNPMRMFDPTGFESEDASSGGGGFFGAIASFFRSLFGGASATSSTQSTQSSDPDGPYSTNQYGVTTYPVVMPTILVTPLGPLFGPPVGGAISSGGGNTFTGGDAPTPNLKVNPVGATIGVGIAMGEAISKQVLNVVQSEGADNAEATHEPTQPNENNLDKIKGNKAADAAARDAGYDSAHDAKYGRGNSSVDIYNDKTTGQKWLWDGKKGSGKEQL